MKKGLVVLFPGVKYSAECPLLYYGGLKYEMQGYEKLSIVGYGIEYDMKNKKYSLEEYAKKATESVKRQLSHIDFSIYENVVFVAKSIGTVLALWAEDYFGIEKVTQVLLTPINETLPYLTKDRNVKFMVSGTKDELVNLEKLQEVCQKKDLPLMTIENLGHRLETTENIQRNVDIIRELVDYM